MSERFCGKCGFEFRPAKTGMTIETIANIGSYKKYQADLWRCSNRHCDGALIITADQARAEHYEEDYDKVKVDRQVFYAEVARKGGYER